MSKELEDFIKYLVKEKGLSESSVSFYRTDLIQFENFLNKSIIKAKSEDVIEFLASIKKSENDEDKNEITNKRTLNRKLSSINSFFKFSYKKEWMDNKLRVKQFKIPKQLPKYITIEEFEEGIKKIDSDNWLALRDKALLLFLYATGLTVSEAMNAKKSDIQDGWLKVNGNKERIVPIAIPAIKALNEYLFKRPMSSEYLFINSRGGKLSRISAFYITKKYLNISPHILRHSFATSLILGGVKLKVIQELLGHRNMITTYNIYTKLQKADIFEEVKKFHPLKEFDE